MTAALALAVSLNHCYVAPDRATFDAIAGDSFLRGAFASFEERTTKRTDKTYTGLYYYGDHTYFEILEPGKGFSRAGSGIAFGTERAHELARLGKPSPVTREFEGRQVPWFQVVGDDDAFSSSSLTTWTMEYDPRFLAHWYPALPPAGRGISRALQLDRYVAHAGRPRGLLQDIQRIELALLDGAPFAKHCEALGYRVARDDRAYTCTGPGIVLHATPAHPPARLGIVKVTFKLRAPAPRREARRLGSSTLELDGDEAVWRFE